MNTFFRIMGYVSLSYVVFRLIYMVLWRVGIFLPDNRYYRFFSFLGIISALLTMGLQVWVWRFLRPQINQDKWNIAFRYLGYVGFFMGMGFLSLILMGFNGIALIFMKPQSWLLMLIPILLAIWGPRGLCSIGVLKEKWIVTGTAVILGAICFILAYLLISDSLGKAVVSNLDFDNEDFTVPAHLTAVNDKDKAAMVQVLTRSYRVPPFLDRSCPDQQHICELSWAAEAFYYEASYTLTRVSTYWLIVGLSLLTAVTATNLTLYYGSEN